MSTKENLLSSITETETQLKRLQEQLAKQKEELTKLKYPASIQEAEIGDEFEDGTILFAKANFDKYSGIAFFIGNPYSCIFHSNYNTITKNISELNYTTRWFVPSFELFEKAFTTIPECFSSGQYWCSGMKFDSLNADVANIEIKSKEGITSYHISKGHSAVNTMNRVYLFTSVLFDI